MTAAKNDIVIEKGTDFIDVWELFDDEAMTTPTDLTGYTARMQVRENQDSTGILLDLTTANSKIVLGGALGTITFAITDTETGAIAVNKGVYDFELLDAGGLVDRLVYGDVTFSDEVTR